MKRLFLALILLLSVVTADAQLRVVNAQGEAMVGTVVLDCNGTPVGIINIEGTLPEVSAASYPLRLRCLGFEDTVVAQPVEQVVMQEKAYEVGAVTVRPEARPACRVVCFVREALGMTNGEDTVRVVSRYMVDYLFPDESCGKAAGKFPTWKRPRMLTVETDKYKSNDRIETGALKALPLHATLPYEQVAFPEALRGKSSGSESNRSKRLHVEERVYTLTPEVFTIYKDALADYKNHTLSPGLLTVLGMRMEVNECWSKRSYRYTPSEIYDVQNLIASTISINIVGRGSFFQMVFDNELPVRIYMYNEIFPVEISYLTAEEAKALKREKQPNYPMTLPPAAR